MVVRNLSVFGELWAVDMTGTEKALVVIKDKRGDRPCGKIIKHLENLPNELLKRS